MQKGGKCWEVEHMFSDGTRFALQARLVKSGRMKAEGEKKSGVQKDE